MTSVSAIYIPAMDISVIAAWCFVALISLIQLVSSETNYGDGRSPFPSIDSNSLHVTITRNGGFCRYDVMGRGTQFTLAGQCPYNSDDYVDICSVRYAAYFYPNHSPLGLFTDTWGTLVVIREDGCQLMTYQTRAESTLSREVCNRVKSFIDKENIRLEDYWRKWRINFQRSMQRRPPLEIIYDPLTNQAKAPSLYAGQPGAIKSTSSMTNPAGSQALIPQPLTPSLPPLPLNSASQSTGPTILGVTTKRAKDKQTVDQSPISTHFNVINNNGLCVQQSLVVAGQGILDQFEVPSHIQNLRSISLTDLFVMENPSHAEFAMFSDQLNTLYLFEGGWCTRKIYSTSGLMTTSRAELMSSDDCAKVKGRLDRVLKRKGIVFGAKGGITAGVPVTGSSDEEGDVAVSPVQQTKPPPLPLPTNSDGENINSERIIVKTSFLPSTNGECKVEISLAGKGVKDKLAEPCSDKPADTVSTKDVFVFGHLRDIRFSLYSNERNVLYVIKNKICTRKSYNTVKGVTTITRAPVKFIKCNEIKRAASQILSNRPENPANTPATTASSSPNTVVVPPAAQVASSPTALPSPNLASGAVKTNSLKQFEPSYPFPLNNDGTHSSYNMQVHQHRDSFNVRGCNYYITAKGCGVNDHFQVSCSNERNLAISTRDFMFFGCPTCTLGLFTETPSTLIILNKGTCYKKTYGASPTGPTLMAGADCEWTKRRMLERMDTNGKSFRGGLRISGNNESPKPSTAYTPIDFSDKGFSPKQGRFNEPNIHDNVNFYTDGHIKSAKETFLNALTESLSSVLTPATTPGISYRPVTVENGRLVGSEVTVNVNRGSGDQCNVEIIGRDINDDIQVSCSVLGDNMLKVDTPSTVVMADPSKHTGFYSDQWGSLVFVNEELCFKKTYVNRYNKDTEINTRLMKDVDCSLVKLIISATLAGSRM